VKVSQLFDITLMNTWDEKRTQVLASDERILPRMHANGSAKELLLKTVVLRHPPFPTSDIFRSHDHEFT
jgi:hypothetical protein